MRLPAASAPSAPLRRAASVTHDEDPTGGRRWPLWALAVLAGSTLAAVAWQRTQIDPVMPVADARLLAPVTWQRTLHFEDRPDGSIAVLEAPSRREVARFEGEQGFARGVLRTLAHARQRRGIGPQDPFTLTGLANGRLTLADPATGERIDLESFGPTNRAVFARLRDAGAQAAPAPSQTPGQTKP